MTGYGIKGTVSIRAELRIFLNVPQGPFDPPSILFIGYREICSE
jgi:hypothetical protein